MMIAFLVAVLCAGLGIFYHYPIFDLVGGIVMVIPAIFLWIVIWLKNQLMGSSKSSSVVKKRFTEKIIQLLLRYFTKTPLVVLKQMLQARTDSVLLLNMSVFLKRIRQLLYNKFYDSPQWRNRGKGNHIYDLAFSSDIYSEKNPPPAAFLMPNEHIKIVAQTAVNMGTTLWFDEENTTQQHSEACIIACGQFTTCYNLLEYIERLLLNPSVYDPVYQPRLLDLKEQMQQDYERFKNDPFFMYNQDGIDYRIDNFKPLNVNDIPFPGN